LAFSKKPVFLHSVFEKCLETEPESGISPTFLEVLKRGNTKVANWDRL
jgi:hypothetical protein